MTVGGNSLEQAPDFTLADEHGRQVTLATLVNSGPVLLAFYPKDFTPVCTKQLCGYAEDFSEFAKFGVQIFGVSKDSPASHLKFSRHYDLPFPLLTDPGNDVAKAYGCASKFMLGKMSRAVVLISKERKILYRHVEPTVLTHRKSMELIAMLKEAKIKQDG